MAVREDELGDSEPLTPRELLEEIVLSLVDRTESVKVSESSRGKSKRLEIQVEPEDRGLVIGKQGRTITALRVLFGTLAAKNGHPVEIEIAEGERDRPRRPFTKRRFGRG